MGDGSGWEAPADTMVVRGRRMVQRIQMFAAAVAGMLGALGLAGFARAVPAPAPQPSKESLEFFENRIRPVLLDRCYTCHDGSGAKAVKGGFTLDTRDGLLRGGESGKPAIVPGDPAASRLISAIKW